MKKGYQKILRVFEEKPLVQMTLSDIRASIWNMKVTSKDLFELEHLGLLESDKMIKDHLGNNPYKLTKEGFNHLWTLRVYHVSKKMNNLTKWIKWLTLAMIIVGIIQIIILLIPR